MPALLIIDVQNDFGQGGSLEVPGASEIIPIINDLVQNQAWDLVVATMDYHPKNHISFASRHGINNFDKLTIGGVQTLAWPDHCIQNSWGAELMPALDVEGVAHILQKGTDQELEFYSAFQDITHSKGTGLCGLLESYNVHEIVVVGLALDYCVMETALDGVRFGFATSVLLGATRAIAKDTEVLIERLRAGGVHVVE